MLFRIRKPGECSGRAWLVVLLAGGWALLAVPAQAATCGPDPEILPTSPITFVGTVVGVTELGDVATFTVEEVWGSEALGATVRVSGEMGIWAGSTAGRYLVLAVPDGDRLTLFRGAGACRAFFVMDPNWEEFRPASAHPPLTPDTQTDVPVQLLLGAVVLAVIVLVSTIAFRPGRSRES